MREDGINSGHRNIGILALAFIPWALGLGVSLFIGIYIGIHNFKQQQSLEQRAAIYTDSVEKPKSKIKIIILQNDDCCKITKVDIDGNKL